MSNLRLSWTTGKLAGKLAGKPFGRQVGLWFPLNSQLVAALSAEVTMNLELGCLPVRATTDGDGSPKLAALSCLSLQCETQQRMIHKAHGFVVVVLMS